jgi:Zn-dependent protease
VRVRTYGFPGCFTRPPGTSTRDHPHEPTASKPVVPVDVLPVQCSWSVKQVDAVPGRFEEPFAGWPEGLPTIGGAASHLGGLALCGSGSASTFNVRLSASFVKGPGALSPHVPKKSDRFARQRDETHHADPSRSRETPREAACERTGDRFLGEAYRSCDNERMDSELPVVGENPFGAQRALGESAIAAPMRHEADVVHTGAAHASEAPFGTPRRSLRKRLGSALAGIGAIAAKFATYIKSAVLLLPKLKLLTTGGTALVSIAAYSLLWGWPFAAGFVALLFVHEMGHVIQLRREGIKASTPMFIPFLGAAIFSRSLGDDALAEARVGLAGPILGTLGALAVAVAGAITGSDLLLALAYIAFFLNLINLIPVVPFDGGRAMAAVAPSMWFLGIGGLVAMILLLGNPFLLIFILLALREMPRRWRQLRSRSIEQAAYYRVPRRSRIAIGAVYVVLIVVLAFGMSQTHILVSAGHSFRSI